MKALEITNLEKSFKNNKVLGGLSLSIEEGQAYGLVGLNGIGKTTTIKVIIGLCEQDSGEYKIFGDSKITNATKLKYAYLPEKFTPSQFLTGEEFLRISMNFHNKEYNAAEAAIVCKELDFNPNELTKRVGKYSKGMGQKLGLVSMFMSGAKLLILDEPMSGLDPRARIFLKHKLISFKQAGNSIFFSSHVLADVEEICDMIGIIHDGDLKYQGNVDKFIKDNKSKTLEQAYLKVIS